MAAVQPGTRATSTSLLQFPTKRLCTRPVPNRAGLNPACCKPLQARETRDAEAAYRTAPLRASQSRYPTAEDRAALAVRLDRVVRESAPAGWKGDQAREAQVLNALYPVLDRDREATRAVFEIVKNQPGY